MPETDDSQLLRDFAERQSDAAFAALVTRHVNLVYSAALRQTDDPHAAEEITQAVFIILARKAGALGSKAILSGWLYQAARLTAANFLRSQIRRQQREREAYMQSLSNEAEPDVWSQIAPLLDDALGQLGERDRHAIVLRFFENRSLGEVGAALGASEDAAKMRVNRTLEKLRRIFSKHGVTLTAAAAKGAAVGGSTLALVKGALKLMAWAKMKTAVVVGVGLLLAAGTVTLITKELKNNQWRVERPDIFLINKVPPQVKILPTKFARIHENNPPQGKSVPWGTSYGFNGKAIGVGVGIEFIAQAITGTHFERDRMILPPGDLLTNCFDVIANLPSGSQEALAREARKVLGIVVRREVRDMNVLVLKVNHSGAPGMRPGGTASKDAVLSGGKAGCRDAPLVYLVQELEMNLGTPIIDKTGLTNNYDMEYSIYYFSSSPEERVQTAQQVMLKDLGLKLVPSREPIEILVVERVKH